MPDKSGPERYQEFYKFITTLDAAAIIAGLTLRRDLGIEGAALAIPLISFGLSGYLCILGMWLLTFDSRSRHPHSRILKLHFYTALIILLLTSGGVTSLITLSIAG